MKIFCENSFARTSSDACIEKSVWHSYSWQWISSSYCKNTAECAEFSDKITFLMFEKWSDWRKSYSQCRQKCSLESDYQDHAYQSDIEFFINSTASVNVFMWKR